MPLDQVDRIVRIHQMLDPSGTSLKSVEELVLELQQQRDRVYDEGAGSELAVLEVLLNEIHDVPEDLGVTEGINWLSTRHKEAVKDRDWLAAIVYEFMLIGPRQRQKLNDVEMNRFLAIQCKGS